MTAPNLESVCKLGGKVVPGDVTVDVKPKADLDVQKPNGANGYTTKHKGYPPMDVVLKIQLWEQEQIDDFEKNILPLLRPKAVNAAPDPLAIEHRKTARWGVTAITVGDIEDPDGDPVSGEIITVNAIQWTPGPKAAKQPNKAPKAATGTTAPQSVDDGIAGSGWKPSATDAAQSNLGT
jgi:hypothetical protein